jgi:hypothetical protein
MKSANQKLSLQLLRQRREGILAVAKVIAHELLRSLKSNVTECHCGAHHESARARHCQAYSAKVWISSRPSGCCHSKCLATSRSTISYMGSWWFGSNSLGVLNVRMTDLRAHKARYSFFQHYLLQPIQTHLLRDKDPA